MSDHKKTLISANELLSASFALARQVRDSGYRPTLILGVWRGGAPIAIAIHEYFAHLGEQVDHWPLRMAAYSGIDSHRGEVSLDGFDALLSLIDPQSRLLVVDDVFDSGSTMQALTSRLNQHFGSDIPEIRIATPWFKPARNKTSIRPHFYLHETTDWIVFPHELCDLSESELASKLGL